MSDYGLKGDDVRTPSVWPHDQTNFPRKEQTFAGMNNACEDVRTALSTQKCFILARMGSKIQCNIF